jgi:hypothetical protein
MSCFFFHPRPTPIITTIIIITIIIIVLRLHMALTLGLSLFVCLYLSNIIKLGGKAAALPFQYNVRIRNYQTLFSLHGIGVVRHASKQLRKIIVSETFSSNHKLFKRSQALSHF